MHIQSTWRHLPIAVGVMLFALVSIANAMPTSRPTSHPTTHKTHKDPPAEQLTFVGVNGEGYFSPDGKRLIFQSHSRPQHKHTQLYMYDFAAKKEWRVTHHNGDDTCSFFHPTKKLIMYSSTKDEVRESYKYKKFDPKVYVPKQAKQKKKKRSHRRKYEWIYKPYEVYVTDFNNKAQKRVTHAPGYDAEGSFSPDGKKILYSSRRDGDQELYIMNADGTNQRRLTFRRGNDGGPFFSPNGQKITWRSFDRRGNAHVMIADLKEDGLHNIKQLTYKPGINWAPYWHPSGRWLVFSSNRDNRKNFDLFVVDVDGRCVKKLTHHASADVLPVFSPDGKHIVFVSKRVGNKSQLFRMPFSLPNGCESPFQHYKTSRALRFPKKVKKRHRGYHHYKRYKRHKRSYHHKKRSYHHKKKRSYHHKKRSYHHHKKRSYHHHKKRSYHHHKGYKGHKTHPHKKDAQPHKGHHHKKRSYHHHKKRSYHHHKKRSYHHHKGHKGHHHKQYAFHGHRKQKKSKVYMAAPTARQALVRDLYFLSHPALEGRDAGSHGIEVAANYIAHQFKQLKLKKAGDKGSYFQSFTTTIGVKLGTNNALSAMIEKKLTKWTINKDFVPFGFSSSGTLRSKVVFVGYGITDEKSGYDDYKGVDVKDKIVLMFRYTPQWEKKHSLFGKRRDLYASFRYKLLNARTHKAKAVLIVDPPSAKEKVAPKLLKLRMSRGLSDAGILALHVSRAVGKALLGCKDEFASLWNKIEKNGKPQSHALKHTVSLKVQLIHKQVKTRNVVGYIPGTDPKLRDEYVVIGAHYDHLGYGGAGSFPGNHGKIHPGADDNASGTAAIIAMARGFAKHPTKRSLLFIAFSAEERGLLGSAYFVQHSRIPRAKFVTMVNLDMVGRMRGKRLVVHGAGTSPGFEQMLRRRGRQAGLRLRLGQSGYGPSDHTSFYARKIPVLFFFTGAHSEYHRPTDVFKYLNVQGISWIIHMVQGVVREVADGTKPSYRKVMDPRPRKKMRGRMRAYLGTIPDYGTRGIVGVKLTGARSGGPADKAGVKGGDILVQIGKFPLRNLYDMVIALKHYRAGDKVDLVVIRGGKRIKLKATFGNRASRSQ
ncbi:MAG: hypothetical protein CL920_22370 [Deltaproteobacteria bacterium]|nr:hypothetical protein [Deltaproteobacteria bacterium]MBU51444.1 hypothetical protein [Deltaproteobacteria bacterium]